MVIERERRSYKKSNLHFGNGVKETPVNMNIDLRTFNIFCRYVLSTSSYLRIQHLMNLKKLIFAINPATYENDPEKLKRVTFIKYALEARIAYNLNDLDMILDHIYSRLTFDVDFIDLVHLEMDQKELLWVHQMVSESIKYYFVYDVTDKLLDLCTRIKTSEYAHRGELIKEFEETINDIKNKFRECTTEDGLTDMTFSLRNGEFENAITETYNLITNPSRRLITGMQGLNEMIGGGFESGRVYMFLGNTGVGKSVTLLNLIYQIKRYNKNYKTKDPTKTPCIVLLTMENTVVETITRLFDLSTSGMKGMENYSLGEVLKKLRTEGELVLDDVSPIDIVIKYKANKSINTSYLYTMVDDLEDNGYEVICLIQDHVKRIRSVYGNTDLRIELGDIVNELKVFAAEKDIPVISNCHLNRDAAKIVQEANEKSNKTDITKKLGVANVGESMLMMDNIDTAIIINLDWDEEGNKYMAFNLVKMRDKTERLYMVQPFAFESTIRLVEDVGGVPMFKEFLHMNKDINRIAGVKTSPSNILSNMNFEPNNNPLSSYGNVENYSLTPFTDREEQVEEEHKSFFDKKANVPIIKPVRFIDKGNMSKESLNNLKEELASRKVA